MKPRERLTYYSPAQDAKKTSATKKTRKTMSFVEDEEKKANQTLFDNLMSDPRQREMIKRMLAEQKDNIEAYKREQSREKNNKTPVGKMKRKFIMESPTSLRRRLALEQHRGLNISPALSSRTHTPSPVPFETVLKGVTAYVEIITDNENRSSGCKNLLGSMGAKIKETFTSDVTHVVYKDGLFATYQKAKLMKRHLVSVLWVEEVRNTLTRAPEINFPVLGVEYDVNEICNKMQNEFDEIVREEYRRSIGANSQNLILSQSLSSTNRRKTTGPSQLQSFSQLFGTSATKNISQSMKLAKKSLDDDFVPNSQDDEVFSILLAPRRELVPSSTPLSSTPIASFTSESDPEFALINGALKKTMFDNTTDSSKSNDMLITPIRKLQSIKAKNSSTSTLSSADSTNLIIPKSKISGRKTGAKKGSPKNLKRRQTMIQKTSTSSLELFEAKDVTKSDSKVTRRKKLYTGQKSVLDMLKDRSTEDNKVKELLTTQSPIQNKTKLDNEDMDITNVDVTPGFVTTTQTNLITPRISLESNASDDIGAFVTQRKPKKPNRNSIGNSVVIDGFKLPLEKRVSKNSPLSSEMASLRLSADTNTSLKKVSLGTKETMSSLRLSTDTYSSSKKLSTSTQDTVPSLRISTCEQSKNDDSVDGKRKSQTSAEGSDSKKLKSADKRDAKKVKSAEKPDSKKLKSAEKRYSKKPISTEETNSNKFKSADESDLRKLESDEESDVSEKLKSAEKLAPEESDSKKLRSAEKNDSKKRRSAEKRDSKKLKSAEEIDLKKFKSAGDSDLKKLESDEEIDVSEKLKSAEKPASKKVKPAEEIKSKKLKSAEESDLKKLRSAEKSDSKKGKSTEVMVLATPRTRRQSRYAENRDSKKLKSAEEIDLKKFKCTEGSDSKNLESDEENDLKKLKSTEESDYEKLESIEETQLKKRKSAEGNDSKKLKSAEKKDLKKGKSTEVIVLATPRTRRQSRLLSKSVDVLTNDEIENIQQKVISAEETDLMKLKSVDKSDSKNHKFVDVPVLPTPKTRRQSRMFSKSVDVSTSEEKENIQQKPKRNSSKSAKNINKGNSLSESSSNSDNSMKKRRRKLYNPNQSIDDTSILQLVEAEKKAIEDQKMFRVPAPPMVLTPVVLSSTSRIYKDRSKLSSSSSEEKPKKLKPVKVVRKPYRDSQLDYQKDLHDEYVIKKSISPKKLPVRKSTRKTKKPNKFRKNSSDEEDIDDTIPIKPVNRRSTLDFAPRIELKTPHRTQQTQKKSTATIVCTRFHRKDVNVFQQIVRKLGQFTVENEVSERTTHLVSYEPVRTINTLRAIARGLWVLKPEWIFQSLENGKWLPEEKYEQTEFSASVQHCRIERQSFGTSYSMDVFANCGLIYIGKGTNPPHADLVDLVRLCKGTCVSVPRSADIVVGEHLTHPDVVYVKETWILDSITLNKCKNINNYLLKPAVNKRISDHF